MQSDKCFGHEQRQERRNKINKLLTSPPHDLDETKRVLIKKGPVSKETSIKELEEIYASTASWKAIEDGGVLSVPLEEFRMMDPPKPNQATGQVDFGKAKGGKGTKIENYTVGETIGNLNAIILEKYNEIKEKAKAAGKSKTERERERECVFHYKAFHRNGLFMLDMIPPLLNVSDKRYLVWCMINGWPLQHKTESC